MDTYTGIVEKGAGRGAVLGYPTANIALEDTEVSGVFAARVTIGDEAPYMAAVFADPKRQLLEAHILDFSDDLYGLTISIALLKKIRDHKDFADDAALKSAIASDIVEVRAHFTQ